MMTKRTVIFSCALVALVLFLLHIKRLRQDVYAKPVPVEGVDKVTYASGDILFDNVAHSTHGAAFDWFNGEQCGCDNTRTDALVIQSIRLAPRVTAGYQYIPTLETLPAALKGAPSLVRSSPMPDPVSYEAAAWTWWIEWGYNVHHEQAMYYMTSQGINVILGKYSRSNWPNKGPGLWIAQTKDKHLLSGKDYTGGVLISDGATYQHDKSRDQARPININPK